MIGNTKYIVLLLCLLLIGCYKEEKPDRPKNLIPIDKMEDILYDSFVLNAAKASNKVTLERNGIYPQDYLFKKHNIDSAIFAQSNAFYAYDVERYQQLIDNVKERLQKEKNVYSEILKKEDEKRKRKQDSIKEARKRRNDSIRKLNRKKKELKTPLTSKGD